MKTHEVKFKNLNSKNSILIGKKQNCDGVISVCEDQAIHPFIIQKIEDGFLRPFIGG